MTIDPTPSKEEQDRARNRHVRALVVKGKANRLVRYYDGAEAAGKAAGLP